MKLLSILAIFGIFLLKCATGVVQPRGSEQAGYLVNSLAADGCGWHLEVKTAYDAKRYAFDLEKNQPKLDSLIQNNSENGMYRIAVLVRYRETGKERKVTCGWGKETAMPEIELLSVAARPKE